MKRKKNKKLKEKRHNFMHGTPDLHELRVSREEALPATPPAQQQQQWRVRNVSSVHRTHIG